MVYGGILLFFVIQCLFVQGLVPGRRRAGRGPAAGAGPARRGCRRASGVVRPAPAARARPLRGPLPSKGNGGLQSVLSYVAFRGRGDDFYPIFPQPEYYRGTKLNDV